MEQGAGTDAGSVGVASKDSLSDDERRDSEGDADVDDVQLALHERDLKISLLQRQLDEQRYTAELAAMQAEQEKRQSDERLRAEVARADAAFAQLQRQTQQQLRQLSERVVQLHSQAPVARQRVAELKRDLDQLEVSEAVYDEINAVPESRWSLQQFVQHRVYRQVRQAWAERDAAVQDRAQLQSKLDHVTAELEAAERAQTTLRVRADTASAQADTAARELARVSSQRDKETKQLQTRVATLSAAAAEAEALRSDLRDTQAKLANASAEHQASAAALQREQEERERASAEAAEQAQRARLLDMDKAYLSKDADALREALRRSEDARARAERDLAAATAARDDLVAKALAAKEQARSETQAALDSELRKLEERARQDREALAATTTQVHQREVASLCEARDAARRDVQMLRTALDDSRAAHDTLASEHRSLQAKYTVQLDELTSALKVKSYELEREAIAHESASAQVDRLNRENAKLSATQAAVTKEYYQLRADAAARASQLEASVAQLEHELASYRSLDTALDGAVIAAAAAGSQDVAPTAVPASAQRRMQQSLRLGKQAVHAGKEADQLRAQVKQLRQRITQLEEDQRRTQALLHVAKQPHAFLVDRLQLAQRSEHTARRDAARLERHLAKAKKQLEQCKKQLAKTSADLARMMQQREKLAELRQVVTTMRAQTDRALASSVVAVSS